MKICLATIHANARFTPLALLYLKAWLVEREGLPRDAVAILEFTKESSRDDIVGDILAAEPDVVGLSCYVWNVQTLMAVAAAIKARRPAAKIVLGGPGGRSDRQVRAGRASRRRRDRPQRRRGAVRRDRAAMVGGRRRSTASRASRIVAATRSSRPSPRRFCAI